MKIKMELLSDVIFGNGESIPGAEDISVQKDKYGFPYYKASTLKGVFREEMEKYLTWIGKTKTEINNIEDELLGTSGDDEDRARIIFSDFTLSPGVRTAVLKEVGTNNSELVLDLFTNTRAFTSIDANGIAKQGSLRMARCVNQGLYFYSEISCSKEDKQLVEDVLSLVKWIGSSRNRGFGKVKITVEGKEA